MRKFLCIIIIIIISLYGINFISFAEEDNSLAEEKNTVSTQENAETNSSTQENNISILQQKQKEWQNKLQTVDKDLTLVQDELSENLQQIDLLDQQIEQAQKEIEESNKKIEQLNLKNQNIQARLKVATDKYEKQKELLESRLIAMYEAGEVEYLDVILSSADISEFLSNYVLVDEIVENDKNFLREVEEKKQIIEIASQNLKENLQQLNIIKYSQERDSKILDNIKIIREKYIAKLTEQEKEIQKQIDEYKLEFQKVNKEILDIAYGDELLDNYVGGALAWPVPGYTLITPNYGMRVHPITGYYKLHTGVDIGAPMGAEFVAANDGIVTKAYYNSAYGNMVMIDHGGGISTLYAHGSEILVNVGQPVKKNEPVLKVGSTGYSTGPHAHFEVRLNGVVTNPMDFITSDKTPEEVIQEQIEHLDKTNNENDI